MCFYRALVENDHRALNDLETSETNYQLDIKDSASNKSEWTQ